MIQAVTSRTAGDFGPALRDMTAAVPETPEIALHGQLAVGVATLLDLAEELSGVALPFAPPRML